jgi:sigma-B regulation protein RsbU (phosphoserine phosphatase)
MAQAQATRNAMPPDATLLVVDDNEDNRYTLTQRLKRLGYSNVATAVNGREALARLRETPHDLMLLDVMMPEMNGYQVLEHLQADERLRQLPVIMISANDQVESVIRCIELGAEDYLPKPFNPTLLRARVSASLEKKRLRDEVRASLNRLERELDAARSLQLGMLPRKFPEWSAQKPVRVHALMEPAREVGGDLYDFFFALEDVLCFVVADVSGKGAPAAMFMARTRSLVRLTIELFQQLGAGISPQNIAEAVNRELCQDNHERMFVTMFLGFLDTRTGALAYINAGHPPPHVLRAGDGIERIEGKPVAPLGVSPRTIYETRTSLLQPGDAVFVCTDGISEAMNSNDELFGSARLDTHLSALRNATPDAVVRTVKEQVDQFIGGAPKADDLTMLAVRWEPAAA